MYVGIVLLVKFVVKVCFYGVFFCISLECGEESSILSVSIL